MGKSLTRKIIESHYVSGSMVPGEEVFIKVDQTLTHDINAVMTYLAFEARIHKGNLINHGIIPMIFESPEDYDKLEQGDELEFENLLDQIPTKIILVKDKTKNISFYVKLDMSENEIEVILSGGQLSYLKKQLQEQQ